MIPSPEFCAACRIVIGADAPDALIAAFKTPLGADIRTTYDDILAGRRSVRLPLDPPAGALSNAHMFAALQVIGERRLDDVSARAVVRAIRTTTPMKLVGARLAEQRDKDARATR
jgi:hypothetical protein